MPGESFIVNCSCEVLPGTTPPATTRYVVSLNDLVGQVTLAGTGSTSITSSGNTITIGLTAEAGLGSVTSVGINSGSNNLTVSGSPVTTNGTITLDLALALDSIAGLTTAADQMIYTTASNTYATTSLTAFARTLLDDAAASNARSTLGLVIGTNVQAWSSDLDSFVTNVAWGPGPQLQLTGSLDVTDPVTFGDNLTVAGTFTSTGLISGANGASISGDVTAATFTGSGAALTGLSASNVSTGTLAVARGGTNISSYTIGDLIYASGATTLSKLADVAAGSYLRSGGVATAPVWSTLTLPNTATTGDILYASASNTISRLADVATGSVIISGGVGAAPTYGKVTSAHVDSTIPTMSAGVNADLTEFFNPITFTDVVTLSANVQVGGGLEDGSSSVGNANDVLISTGTGVVWSTGLDISTLTINTSLSTEGTITAGGTTGAQTINKMSGTVRFAGGASSLVVTNSLCTTSSRVLAVCTTNDTTAYVKNVVATSGAFTITLGAAATAETEVSFFLFNIS